MIYDIYVGGPQIYVRLKSGRRIFKRIRTEFWRETHMYELKNYSISATRCLL